MSGEWGLNPYRVKSGVKRTVKRGVKKSVSQKRDVKKSVGPVEGAWDP